MAKKTAKKSRTPAKAKKAAEPAQSRPVGRPTDFRADVTDELIEYFSRKPYTEDERGKTRASDFPSLAGFAVKIGVHRDTLHEWANARDDSGDLKHAEFSDAYARAKDFQENWILVNGNKGLAPTAFVIFTAKNVVGYRDRQSDEAQVIVNNYEKLSDEELDAKIARLQEATAKPKEGK